jgi:hypothetical protein
MPRAGAELAVAVGEGLDDLLGDLLGAGFVLDLVDGAGFLGAGCVL